jgi:hypothetical protein
MAEALLPVVVWRIEPRQLLNIEQPPFERALRTRRRHDQRIHLSDQQVDVGGMCQERHAAGFPRPARRARV